MATADVLAPHDVPTTMNYYQKLSDESPYVYNVTPEGKPTKNYGTEPHEVVVHDVRGKEDTVSLDKNGFAFVKHESVEKDFTDEERVTTVYYNEVEELLKKELGAKRVFIFDHTIRRNYSDGPTTPQTRSPVEWVHIDQTFEASVNRVHRHLGADAERLLKGRVRIINVWRPINHPVFDRPLAVADWRTLDVKNGLVPVRLIYPDREGGIFGVNYNKDLTWYYLSGQKTDEVTFIKCYDSEEDRARLTPHSAFFDASSPKDVPKRESIEVRCLVFDLE